MDLEQFKSGPVPGELVDYEGYYAFNPDPLPPDNFGMDTELSMAHAEALQAVAELKGIGRNVSNPRMLIRPFIRKEAVLSSRIEGTRADLSDVYAYEVGQENSIQENQMVDTREVVNYVNATERGLHELRDGELDLELVKKLHAILMNSVRGEDKDPGELRDQPNYIGPPDADIEEARYVPPPSHLAEYGIRQLSDYMNEDLHYPPLIEMGLVHYQFEAIHPFLDGNGRMGRLLMTLMMCEEGLLDDPFLYVSAYFNRYRDDYINHLYNVSAEGVWKEWLMFFLDAIKTQANEAYIRSSELLQLKDDYREMYRDKRSKTHLQLVNFLFTQPYLTVKEAEEELDVTYQAANNAVKTLVEDDVLVETTGKKRNRMFRAIEIMDIIEQPIDNIELKTEESKEVRQANLGEYAVQ